MYERCANALWWIGLATIVVIIVLESIRLYQDGMW